MGSYEDSFTFSFTCYHIPEDTTKHQIMHRVCCLKYWRSKLGILNFVYCRLNSERKTFSYMQREIEEHRLELIEASQSLVRSQSQASFLQDLQQQCAHLRFELDAARLKLDYLTEQQSQKAPHPEISLHHQHSVEKLDKGLQTILPLLADDSATTGPEGVPSQVGQW
jgi:DNA repair exonuclease SbcCD ATPase subunit